MKLTTTSYLDFVANYFNIQKERIIIDNEREGINIESLKSSLGPLNRQLSSLHEVKKGGVHACIVRILTVSKKIIEKEEKLFTIVALLVADQYSICKMVLFDNDDLNKSNLRENTLVRLHEAYYDKKEVYESVIKLKRGGNIYQVPFNFTIPGMSSVQRPVKLEVDQIGDYVSDPKHVSYIQELGIINVIGVLWVDEKNKIERYKVFGEQFKVVIWVREDLKEFLNQHCLNRKVELTYVKIKYGRDSLELGTTEFTKIIIKNYVQIEISEADYYRYEYPAQVMSLKEMLDTGLVAKSKVAITHIEDRQTDEGKEYCAVYLYDSTALIRLFLFEKEVIDLFKEIPLFTRFRIISGLYRKTMRQDPKYANALPMVTLRVKDVNEIVDIEGLSDDYFEPTVTLLNTIIDFSQPIVTEGILKKKDEMKAFHYKDGSVGYKMTFTIEQLGETYRITTFNKRDVQLLDNIELGNEIRVWWVKFKNNRYIVENYGRIVLI